MAYSKQDWTNGSGGGTPLSAARLDYMEEGIRAAAAAADGKANASHTHGVTDLTATGTRSSTTFLRGDNTWAAPPSGTGGGVTDHGALTGLADDDHPQYLNQTRGDARYAQTNDSRITGAAARTAVEGIKTHDGTTGGGTRPTGFARVRWVGGTTRPTNMATGDVWEH